MSFLKIDTGVPMAHAAVASVPRLMAELRAHIIRKTGKPIDPDMDFLTTQIEVLSDTQPILNEWAGLTLTRYERRILDCLSKSPNRTFSRVAIMDTIYFDKPDDQPQARILDVFVIRIRNKLAEAHSDFCIETVRNIGFRLVKASAVVGMAQRDRSVLITGGTGSLGRALTARLLQTGCRRVCILSRGEHAQAEMRAKYADEPRLRYFIGDVRDRDRLRRAFEGVDVVIHAAALKRVEVGTYEPLEMVKTNVIGTVNVVEAALDAKVLKVIGISTDKAYAPKNPYGCSKAMAEAILLAANNLRGVDGPRFAVARLGNLWGSQGSVVPKWHQMIADGATTVPVNDPDSTRFFQRLEDAADLVLNLANGDETELLIPELPAFRVGDLAEAFGVGMDFVGIPPWEKKHEALNDELTSDKAKRMSVRELREELGAIAA